MGVATEEPDDEENCLLTGCIEVVEVAEDCFSIVGFTSEKVVGVVEEYGAHSISEFIIEEGLLSRKGRGNDSCNGNKSREIIYCEKTTAREIEY